MKFTLHIVGFVALLGCLAVPADANRFHQYTERYEQPPNPVRLETATLLGGPGTEWLSGGGVQSDGTVVVAGTALGPELELAGTAVTAVLGSDTTEPPGHDGERTPRWDAEGGTGFVVWLSPDLQQITRAVRLPWRAGGITDLVVGPDDGVYITGKVGAAFQTLGEAADVTPAQTVAEGETWGYIARLADDGEGIDWIRRFRDAYKGPRLRRAPDEGIFLEAADYFIFTTDGDVRDSAEGRRTESWYRAVSPLDFSFAVGYDRNTHTGREPWRQPTLAVVGPDGESRGNWYRWSARLVGEDRYRLVSDSSFSNNSIHFADDGTLWAVGWSDGGNTVLERDPRDLDTRITHRGLGFSSWGAGVLSLSHIIQLDPETGDVLNKTLWCGYLPGGDRDRPNSAGVNVLRVAKDGSVLIAGRSAAGLIQTGDQLLGEGTPGGPYVAILEGDLSSIRFSSALPATGQVLLHDNAARGERWSIRSGVADGRVKAVYVCGVVEEQGSYTEPRPAPTQDAVQSRFGGGRTDGYLMVFDLGEAQ